MSVIRQDLLDSNRAEPLPLAHGAQGAEADEHCRRRRVRGGGVGDSLRGWLGVLDRRGVRVEFCLEMAHFFKPVRHRVDSVDRDRGGYAALGLEG